MVKNHDFSFLLTSPAGRPKMTSWNHDFHKVARHDFLIFLSFSLERCFKNQLLLKKTMRGSKKNRLPTLHGKHKTRKCFLTYVWDTFLRFCHTSLAGKRFLPKWVSGRIIGISWKLAKLNFILFFQLKSTTFKTIMFSFLEQHI